MDTLDEALRAHIDELAGSDMGRKPILSTSGTQVAMAELIARHELAASPSGGTPAHVAAASDR
jgi:hypothetical protein